jgi:hypothetical protein
MYPLAALGAGRAASDRPYLTGERVASSTTSLGDHVIEVNLIDGEAVFWRPADTADALDHESTTTVRQTSGGDDQVRAGSARTATA